MQTHGAQFANLANRAYDIFSAVSTFVDLLTFDPSDLLDITKALKKFEGFDILDNASGLVRLPSALIKTPRGQIALPDMKIRGKLGQLFKFVTHTNKGQELIGEVGASLVAGLLGFETTAIVPARHGIDAVLYNETIDKWLILEAKGGTSKLGRTLGHGKQFSHRWITDRLDKMINKNMKKGGDHAKAATNLRKAFRYKQMLTMVVSLDIRSKDRLKIGLQPYSLHNRIGFKDWTGF